jgi:hypothetical protein
MDAQLDHALARQRTAQLRHAGEQTRLAHEAGMRRRKLRHRNLITCLRARPGRALGQTVVPAMLALSAQSASADRLGQVSEFSSVGNPYSIPWEIAPGSDGNLCFTDPTDDAIGRIGAGAAPALQAPACVSGAGVEGSAETCHAQWSDWAGYSPRIASYPLDGYGWLRDGTPPTASQTAPTYFPTAGDIGHQLACRMTVTYPLPFSLTPTATSPATTVQPAPPPPPTPALSALDITPRMFTLTGRRVGGRCEPSSRADRGERSCTRRVMLRGTTVINGRAGAHAFTFTGRVDGRGLAPGSYLLAATPTADGIAGQQQPTTFEITR